LPLQITNKNTNIQITNTTTNYHPAGDHPKGGELEYEYTNICI